MCKSAASVTFFALLNAGLAASAFMPAAAPAAAAGTPGSDAANAIDILTTCTDLNLGGSCLHWTTTVLPSGCGDLIAAGQNDVVTSVQMASGIQCTLFADAGCLGRSQLVVGTINDLRTVGFDDTASSFNCAST